MMTLLNLNFMTDNNHPITPPPELVQQWFGKYFGCNVRGDLSDIELYLANQAARWGLQQHRVSELRIARRPNPKSQAEEALEAQGRMWARTSTHDDWELVRAAIERLRALEGQSDG